MISYKVLSAVQIAINKIDNQGRGITARNVYERLRMDGNRLSRTYILEVLLHMESMGIIKLISGESHVRVYEVSDV